MPLNHFFFVLDPSCQATYSVAAVDIGTIHTTVMLALKKKREQEQQAAAEAAAEGGGTGTGGEKVSVLGIGGKKQAKSGDGAAPSKKRSPGEIRIQKGSYDN
jgi:hypothetical protein